MIKKGFTLVELIIVVAILAILAAFAVPNYFNFLKTVTITEQTEKVAAELRYIRDYAAARSIPCVLTITAPNVTPGSYRFNEDNSGGEDIVLPSEPTVEIPFPEFGGYCRKGMFHPDLPYPFFQGCGLGSARRVF